MNILVTKLLLESASTITFDFKTINNDIVQKIASQTQKTKSLRNILSEAKKDDSKYKVIQ